MSNRRNDGAVTARVILGLTAVGLIVGAVLFYRAKLKAKSTETGAVEERRVSVVVAPAQSRLFEHRVVAQGNLEAKNYAVVSPRIAGTLESIFVDEGDSVIGCETKLFATDSLKMEQTVEIRRHELAVAGCARREAAANLEKVEADLAKAELDYDRFKRLYEKGATTADILEQQQSRYKQLAAAQKLAQAQVDLAAEQQSQAEAALAISEKDLSDSVIYAPISGSISERYQEPGEMGEPGKSVVRIEDTAEIEVSAYLPAEYYGVVKPGETKMSVAVAGVNIGRQAVSYKSPTINPRLRTFEVKCLLDNSAGTTAPGAMAEVAIVLESREGLGVPSTAIEQRGGRPVVFVVRDDVAHQLPVKTGIEDNGIMEIRESDLTEETPVVVMGQYMLDEGTAVLVQKEGM